MCALCVPKKALSVCVCGGGGHIFAVCACAVYVCLRCLAVCANKGQLCLSCCVVVVRPFAFAEKCRVYTCTLYHVHTSHLSLLSKGAHDKNKT